MIQFSSVKIYSDIATSVLFTFTVCLVIVSMNH